MSNDLGTALSKTEAVGLWEKISDSLRSSMDPETFDLWLKPVRQVSFNGSHLTLGVPNRFFNDWIILHCKDKIESVLQTLAGSQTTMEFVIFQDQHIPAKEAIPEITELLQNNNPDVRLISIYALTNLKAKETIPEIKKLLYDKDERVRKTAEDALKNLGVPAE